MKQELKQVRRSMEARLKAGSVPDWSWHRHVQLLEAIDAILHDLTLMPDEQSRHIGRPFRLVPRDPRDGDVSEQRQALNPRDNPKSGHRQ